MFKRNFSIYTLFFLVFMRALLLWSQGPTITLNEKEYFSAPGFSFLVFHNNYQVGKQGGLQLIQQDERLLDSGDLLLVPKEGSLPEQIVLKRTVDRSARSAIVFGEVTGWHLGYQLTCQSDGKNIQVRLKLDKPLDWTKVSQAGFKILIYPGAYFQRSFQTDNNFGVFPQSINERQLATEPSKFLRIAQEDPRRAVTFSCPQNRLQLLDMRQHDESGWFVVVADLAPGSAETEISLTIAPTLLPGWQRPPVLGLSQVGYHTNQVKKLVLELDPRDPADKPITIYRMQAGGEKQKVFSKPANPWGNFLRYRYATVDFSEIRQPGLYWMEFGNQTAGPIEVSNRLYQEIWKPTLEYFLPIQMCHVAVKEGNRTWHGACHLDDALQAPAQTKYIDGYQQGERETPFADNEHINGLDWGGWHDAGDNDLPAGSIAITTLPLALAQEEFHPSIDQTTINRAERLVLLNTPDAKSDLLQQIAYGAESLLAMYQPTGHVLAGIIESTSFAYGHVGDTVNGTDNRIYDPSLKPNQAVCDKSGKFDDRWVFTNRNTGLQYQTAQALAAASRVLQEFQKDLAEKSLQTAVKLWEYEQTHPPVYAPNAYAPEDSGCRSHEIAATAELLMTTRESRYQSRLLELMPVIRATTTEQFGTGAGWVLVRALPLISDANLKKTITELATNWKVILDKRTASNPYGVPYNPGVSSPEWKLESRAEVLSGFVWGHGWDLQEEAVHAYFYHKNLPAIFGRDLLFNVVNFVMGCHPANNRSLVSAVGLDSALVAYGFNRNDWTHIPGGVISGPSLIKPDFMELKLYPHFWYQTEYVISGAATFIFDVLAANKWLEQ
jgi:endoglucanase